MIKRNQAIIPVNNIWSLKLLHTNAKIPCPSHLNNRFAKSSTNDNGKPLLRGPLCQISSTARTRHPQQQYQIETVRLTIEERNKKLTRVIFEYTHTHTHRKKKRRCVRGNGIQNTQFDRRTKLQKNSRPSSQEFFVSTRTSSLTVKTPHKRIIYESHTRFKNSGVESRKFLFPIQLVAALAQLDSTNALKIDIST